MSHSVQLPSPDELERICKGLATLDAIVCADWESRYYSFDAAWSANERMASMRNGSGDDWNLVFETSGVFMKAFWHEYPRRSIPAWSSGSRQIGRWPTSNKI